MKKSLIALFTLLSLPQAWALSLSITYTDWGEFSYDDNVVCSMSVNADDPKIGVVTKHDKYGLADSTGKVLIPLEYDDGKCLSGHAAFLKQGKWGVVDSTHRVLMPFIFDKPIQDFNGVDKVIVMDNRDDGTHWLVYGANGQTVLEYQHSNLRFENDNIIRFENYKGDRQSGFMDSEGNVILKGRYEWVKLLDGTAGDERFLVRTDNKTLMLDRHKNTLTQGYDNMEPFDKQGISRVYQNLDSGGYKVGFVDRNGTLIVKPSSHRYPMWNDVFGHEWQLHTNGTQCTLFLEDRLGKTVNNPDFPDKSCKLITTPNQAPSKQPPATGRGLWDRIKAWVTNLTHPSSP